MRYDMTAILPSKRRHRAHSACAIALATLLIASGSGRGLAAQDNGVMSTMATDKATVENSPELQLPDSSASPAAVVAALEQALLHIMQMPDADTTTRAALLQPVLERTFDFQRMSRFIFGPRWNQFSEAQQQEFMRALLQLSCASYAANFDSYNGERFATLDAEADAPDAASQRARINRQLITNKQTVAFNYALTRTEQGWQIANIMAKGVSDLALKRSQYSKLYDDGGVAAVLAYISSQTERLYAS